MNAEPFFHHDCDACQFIGRAVINDEKVDFYAHVRDADVSLIYRTGDDVWDYGSCPARLASPLCDYATLALSLYLKYLGADSASGHIYARGEYFKHGRSVLNLTEP